MQQQQPSDIASAASSPSDAYAALNLSAEDMTASPDGDAVSRQRSASPAKRSAALMEGEEDMPATNQPAAASTSPNDATMASGDDEVASQEPEKCSDQATEADSSAMQENGERGKRQEGEQEQGQKHQQGPPPYSAVPETSTPTGTDLSIDDQVRQIMQLVQQAPAEGQKGFIVSYKWLNRVLSRASEGGLKEQEYEKDATEGEVGSIDNSDIVPAGAFGNAITPFEGSKHLFISLLPDLRLGYEYEVLPEEAWKLVVAWYGLAQGQLPIARFAHDTAPPGSTTKNLIFEVYPPIFTIRKVVAQSSRQSSPTTPSAQTNASTTSDLASVKLVASRTERFQTFLARSKTAARVPIKHKVKIWRQLDAAKVMVEKADASQPGVLTPATSRSTSPAAQATVNPSQSLVVHSSTFAKWDEAVDYEEVDAKDETANENYNGKVTLDVLGLSAEQTWILEEQLRGPAGGEYASDARRKAKQITATKQKDTNGSGRASPAPSGMITRGRAKNGKPRGTIGLINLGNTCYMNSALQCISRVEELAIYFLGSEYKKELNSNNPLGYSGKMAKAYAEFVQGLYSPNSTGAYRPGQFKGALANAQPMFSGYGQQDSQEFLSFLVDALHEDLNRIQKKPYIENPDSTDETAKSQEAIRELGEVYQKNHRLRNDSIAMDLFNGFYKNTMVCPDCDKVSITFDPYSLLTLQLPIDNTWHGHISFFPHAAPPVSIEVDLDKNSTWKSVKQLIASKTNSERERLIFGEAFSHKLYKIFSDTDTIAESSLQNGDVLCMYELPEVPSNAGVSRKKRGYVSRYSSPDPPLPAMDSPLADRMAIPLLHSRGGSKTSTANFVLDPQFIMITREEAKDYDSILKKAIAKVTTITSRDFLHEVDSEEPLKAPEADSNPDAAAHTDEDAVADSEGRLTDNSVPSEDGYVDVSVQKSEPEEQEDVFNFTSPDATLPPALRNLFELKYTGPASSGEMFCTGNEQTNCKLMRDRVQTRNLRRSSLESLQSTASKDSGFSGETGSSPVSDEDAPEMVIGGQDFAGEVQSEDELSQPTMNAKQARRGKFEKRRGNKKLTYSKRVRRNSKHSVRSNASRSSTAQPASDQDEYFIRLGEGIVLDWHEEAFDALFGSGSSADDMRGHYTFDPKHIQVQKDPAIEAKLKRRNHRSTHGITLEDCFAETGKTEILSEENAWYCNRCKELRRASKTLEIWKAPDILVVHLKRFSGERYRRDKVDVLVDFPLEGLDLNTRIGCAEDGKEYIYDLFAVDNHYGGLGGGHYTAYAKNFFDGKWYDYNDSSVYEVKKPESVVSTAAYLLFYRRRSSEPLGPPELQELVKNARNPADSGSADGSDAEDSSGEGGRLGDKSSAFSRQLGSSNAGAVGAGAVTETRLRGDDAGRGNEANRAVRLRQTSEEGTGSDEGYQSGALMNQGGGWSFNGLSDNNDEDNTLDSIDTTNTPADTASDRPEAGSDYEDSIGRNFADEFNDTDDVNEYTAGDDANNWSANDGSIWGDGDNTAYIDAPEQQDDSMAMVHVSTEDNDETVEDAPVKEINLDSD